MTEYTMTIAGRGERGKLALQVVNPASGKVFAECPDCTQAELEEAIQAAQSAFPAWRTSEARRREALAECSRMITAHAGALAGLLTQEQGKTLREARRELDQAAAWFAGAAGMPLPTETIQSDDHVQAAIAYRPLGVAAALTPWNLPLLTAAAKLSSNLLCGNTVVLKPSPFTPLTTLRLGELLREALPPGVLNVVSGGDELGEWIVAHPAVRKISFTGAVETGKKVACAAAPDLKRLTLELSGNDPAIVLPDVDPARVARALFWSAFHTSGQACNAIKRLYTHEAIFTALVDELAAIARAVRVGDGLDPGTEMGPVNNLYVLNQLMSQMAEAQENGACLVAGGERLKGAGYFYPPTLVTEISDQECLVTEEHLGPLLPILPFREVDEAVARANDSPFGLCGSVWTNDLERGCALAARLECGTSAVNRHGDYHPAAPFGGMKWSGLGRENGKTGLEGCMEMQVVMRPL
jgi:acyl-CoA reductase-like NAD-dependent aldehyde dehydrogenase